MKKRVLAGLSAAEFLRMHWQKKPLLARAAVPADRLALTCAELFALAARDDFESRIVVCAADEWEVHHGPFALSWLRRLPRTGWTLLVQGVDHAVPEAARLGRAFSWIPYARFDDVMVSYAVPGGGVGPHLDSYDVFLVQGSGKRRWHISAQRHVSFAEDAPLKLITNFQAGRQWTVTEGDVLYLPPRYAHHGVAITECVTWSVGFRAPTAQELGSHFLDFLQDRLDLGGIYSDPDLRPPQHPAEIPRALLRYCAETMRSMRWSPHDEIEFLGCYLTELKQHVVLKLPQPVRSRAAFARDVATAGVRLALPTRMLLHKGCCFINGECIRASTATMRVLSELAHACELRPGTAMTNQTCALLYGWYCAGYIELRPPAHRRSAREARPTRKLSPLSRRTAP